MEIDISVATLDDLESLRHLGEVTYRAHFTEIWSGAGLNSYVRDQFSVAKLTEELSKFETRYLIVTAGGQPSGYAKIIKNQPFPCDTDCIGLELEKIYFLPGMAGKGLGRRVLLSIFNQASVAGHDFVWLDVLKSNLAGRRFYENMGFSVVCEKPFATDLMEVGFWVMKIDAPFQERMLAT